VLDTVGKKIDKEGLIPLADCSLDRQGFTWLDPYSVGIEKLFIGLIAVFQKQPDIKGSRPRDRNRGDETPEVAPSRNRPIGIPVIAGDLDPKRSRNCRLRDGLGDFATRTSQ